MGAKQRAEAQRRLDSVQITSKQNGNDVVISTAYPPRSTLTYPLEPAKRYRDHYTDKSASCLETDHRPQ